MTNNENLTTELTDYCNQIGIDLIGFADPRFFDKYQPDNRPHSFLENLKTIIILGFYLYDLILDAWSKDENKDQSYHFVDSILLNQCYKIKGFLSKHGFKSKIIPYKPGLYLKDAAALAGIGPIGKNNLLITKKYGSQVRLRALVTEAELTYGTPIHKSNYCKDCNICVDSCPANALEQGNYNKVLCHTYCLENLENLSDDTVLWCNICIENCPVGKKNSVKILHK